MRTTFPAGVDGWVRFGPRLDALASYLPTERLQVLLRELHGVALTATMRKLPLILNAVGRG